MSFAEVYHIVLQASVSAHPAEIMSQLSSIPMDDLQEQEIAILYGLVTKTMPCLSGYLPIKKRIIGKLMNSDAVPMVHSRYE